MLQVLQQPGEGLPDVAQEVHLHRIAQAEVLRLEVDLHAPRLAGGREELRVRVVGAHHEEGVAVLQHVVAGAGAEQAGLLRVVGHVARDHVLAQQRGDDPGAEPVRDGEHLLGRAAGSCTDQHRDLRSLVEHGGGPLQLVGRGRGAGGGTAHPGAGDEVLRGRSLHLRGLDIGGEDHHRGPAMRDRGAQRAVQDELRLHGRGDGLDVLRHVLVDALEIDLLLEVAAEGHPGLLAHDRQHGLMVHPSVVQPVEQVHGSRTGGGDAHPDLSGELGMRTGHEGGDLLVRGAYVAEVPAIPLRGLEGAVEAADAVAGVSVEPVQVPGDEAVDDEVADGGHEAFLSGRDRAGSRTVQASARAGWGGLRAQPVRQGCESPGGVDISTVTRSPATRYTTDHHRPRGRSALTDQAVGQLESPAVRTGARCCLRDDVRAVMSGHRPFGPVPATEPLGLSAHPSSRAASLDKESYQGLRFLIDRFGTHARPIARVSCRAP